ncbi:hypothetical protein AYO22_07422 [Fonsecaea multimorphosa]|nr:hypothetical protein AYO22_07422 [Fonsecaea multimorphosa]
MRLEGDTVSLAPNCLGVFNYWPQIVVEHNMYGYDALISYKKHSGEHIFGPVPANMGQLDPDFSDPNLVRFAFMHSRPQIYRTLLSEVQRCGISVHFQKTVTDYFEDVEAGIAGVVTEDGQKAMADVVVAADGVGSMSYKIVTGKKTKARSSGFSMYRAAFPVDRVLADHNLRKTFSTYGDKPRWDFYIGEDTHFTAFTSKDLATFSYTHRDDGSATDSWAASLSPGDVLKVMERTPGWSEQIKGFIKAAPENSIIDWKLLWRDPQPEWTSPGGRVVQIGDAAHSFLPTSGGGATQAVEDATSLAVCLATGGKDNLAVSTKVQQKLRFERVSCHQLKGFLNREMIHRTDWASIAKDPSAIEQKHGDWIVMHDPEAYVNENYWKAYDHVVGGKEFVNSNVPKGWSHQTWTIEQVLNQPLASFQESGDWSIRQLGVGHVMGVPGDMNLELLDYIREVPGLIWVGNANELNAAYAADGYARVKGVPGVLVTTHGVGELSAINGIAGAYTEQVPVIHIVGATPMTAQKKRAMIHHNLGPNPDHRVYADIPARVRCHVAYLDDASTAPALIDATIQECLNQWLPVYIYVPLDYVHALVAEPKSRLEPNPPQTATMNEKASTRIFDALQTSSKRVVLVDVLATRHGAFDLLGALVDVLNCPIYCTPMGKGAINETHPMYVGIYSGGTSAPGIKEAVESSDCVLHLGPLLADSNTGAFSMQIEENRLISIDPYQCVAFGEVFEGTHIKTILKEILKLATSQRLPVIDTPVPSAISPPEESSDPAITQAWLWKSFGKFLRPNDVLIVEAGTAQFGMPDATFPAHIRYITQVYYGCIGYSVGCCAGAAFAQREAQSEATLASGRLILVVGDGSIQLSVQEIGTMIRAGLKPIIVLLNNDGYTIERTIHRPNEVYHDIAQWRWQSMLDFFGAENPATASSVVRTKAELESKMSSPELLTPTQMQLVELRMDKFDAPWRLKRQVEIVNAGKQKT